VFSPSVDFPEARSHQSFARAQLRSTSRSHCSQAQRVSRQDSHDTTSLTACRCKCPRASAQYIPFIYRLWHLWLEPPIALSGVYHLHWAPEQYFAYMPQTARYSPASQIVYNQLAASYLFFAVVEGLVLRSTYDLRVWRAVVFALLLCDAGHLYVAWLEMGTRGFLCAWLWRSHDAATMTSLILPFVLRIAFLSNAGFAQYTLEQSR
jgi:hypothetical protein